VPVTKRLVPTNGDSGNMMVQEGPAFLSVELPVAPVKSSGALPIYLTNTLCVCTFYLYTLDDASSRVYIG
jgi:hypothetical protein